jgi:ABC-type Fe3+-hydroxamate transport system substrate-binding protein
MLILLLTAVCCLGTGCQSVSGSAHGSSSGTPLGVATLTITAASYVDNTVISHSVFLTVNVLPPGSTVDQPSRGAQ